MNNLDDIPVMPTLTLDPFGEESNTNDIDNSDLLMKKDEKDPEEEKLSESERKMVKEFAGKNRYYKYKYDFAIWSWCSKKGSKFF